MNKKNMMVLLCGILIGGLCFGSVGAIAAMADNKTITVSYNDIKLIIDEKPVTPKDATGKVVEPFIYEGTTYLPVRAVAEALGKDVKWDPATSTVIISGQSKPDTTQEEKPQMEISKQAVKLNDFGDLRSNNFEKRSSTLMTPKDNYGTSYSGCLWPKTYYNDVFIEFFLDGKFSKLKGRLILYYDNRSEKSTATYSIIADGKTLLTLDAIQPGEKPIDFELDLQKATILRIEGAGAIMQLSTNMFVNMELYE
jgi:hypothetical protein